MELDLAGINLSVAQSPQTAAPLTEKLGRFRRVQWNTAEETSSA
jgi:hypothetical protein